MCLPGMRIEYLCTVMKMTPSIVKSKDMGDVICQL